jgi:ADP-heptose:LPS heptosyltransferase
MPQNPGDVVMSLHAAAQLRRLAPHAAVDFIAGEDCAELAATLGGTLLRRVFAIPFSALRDSGRAGNYAGVLEHVSTWISELEQCRYALSLNLFQGRFGAFLQGFSRADRKAGLEFRDGYRLEIGSRSLEHLFAVPAARAENPFHAVDLYRFAAAEALGFPFPAEASPPALPRFPGRNPAAFAPQTYLAFHPGAAFNGKRWPAEQWTRLARLCLEAGERIVWSGSQEERAWVAQITEPLQGHASAQENLVGNTSFSQAAALYRDARKAVSGDTVAMHLAAAVGAPVIALFGPSNPVETGPYGPGHWVIQVLPVTATNLDLDANYPDWAQAEGVAELLLRGDPRSLPPNSLWRTEWENSLGVQFLRGTYGQPHAFQKKTALWVDLLRNQDASPEAKPESPLSAALDQAIAKPTAEALKILEQEERLWAEKTANDLVWEAYRIAVNGLPLLPLARHLAGRRKRLGLAWRESRQLAVVSPAPKR